MRVVFIALALAGAVPQQARLSATKVSAGRGEADEQLMLLQVSEPVPPQDFTRTPSLDAALRSRAPQEEKQGAAKASAASATRGHQGGHVYVTFVEGDENLMYAAVLLQSMNTLAHSYPNLLMVRANSEMAPRIP